MTTYNTQNPLGSSDPRDLYDNAENLDNFVNGAQPAYDDRLGKSRKSWQGMEDEFAAFIASSGYEFVGDYAPGIELTGYQQILRDASGEFWRVSGSVTLPYTTTGAGLPEGGKFVAVGDAALRQELALPVSGGNGALHVSGAVIYVGTIADLQALDTSGLVDGQQVHVKEYHAGTGVGGGEFYWDEGGNKSDHNGGYIIDPLHTANKTDASWFSSQNTGSGVFVLDHQATLTPYIFGASESIESSTQLNAYYDHGLSQFGRTMNQEGSFDISQPVLISSASSGWYKSINGVLRVNAVEYLKDAIILATGYQEFDGFSVDGNYHNALSALDGRRSTVKTLHSQNGSGFSVHYNPASSSNMLTVDKIISVGMGVMGKSVQMSHVETSGDRVSLSRRVTLDASNLDAESKLVLSYNVEETLISIDGVPNIVVSYDQTANTVDVFPGKDDGESYADSVFEISYGGGLCTRGSNGGQFHVGLLDSRNSGISWRAASLYGGTVDRLISQYASASIVFGRFPESYGGLGAHIAHLYQEVTPFNVILASVTARFTVASTAGIPVSARFLRPPAYSSDEGTGNSRLILQGFPLPTSGTRYEMYIPRSTTDDISSEVDVTDNGDGAYTVDIPLGREGPWRHIVEGPSNVKLIVITWSELTSVASRHTIEVLLANVNDTGGGTVSTFNSGNTDFVRISGGSVDLSGVWTRKSIAINR